MLIRRALSVLLIALLFGVAASQASIFEEPARITVEELKAKIDSKKEKVVVVDVRKNVTSVIKGAKHIPYDEIERRLNELPKDALIVTVCA
jgi:rhodanese-related sulfurtransferase